MVFATRVLVDERQVQSDPSVVVSAFANDPASGFGFPASETTTTSSYNYWWPYPPGGVVDTSTVSVESTDDSATMSSTTVTSLTTTADIAASDTDTLGTSTSSELASTSDGLTHITAAIPLTENHSASNSASPAVLSSNKGPHTFNILWLTPVFVLVGVLLGATLAGWTYGRWSRRRGRVSSISGNTQSGDDDHGGARGAYAHIATGARVPSGTRRVSARRDDSLEDVRLVADEKYGLSPVTPPLPHFASDNEDDHHERDAQPPATSLLADFTPAVKGWIASVRSLKSLAGNSLVDASPPRRDLENVHIREATTMLDAPNRHSLRRHATVYNPSPSPRAFVRRDDHAPLQRLTPVSTVDDYSFGSHSPTQNLSPQRFVVSESPRSVPTSTPSRYTPIASRPSSKHARMRSTTGSDCTDDGVKVRQSMMERMNLLKDEASIESTYPLELSDDEWPSPSHPRSPGQDVLETIEDTPVIGGDLDNLRRSAEFAREKRHSSAVAARARLSVAPDSKPTSRTTATPSFLSRIKARLDQNQNTIQAMSPTPSEALIASAFRDVVSNQRSSSSPYRPQARTTLGPIRMQESPNASVLSLELQVPPPLSKLSPKSSRKTSDTAQPIAAVRKGEVKAQKRHVRIPSVDHSQDASSIRLTISHSSSSSISSKSGPSVQSRASSVRRTPSPPKPRDPLPNRIPKLVPTSTRTRPSSSVVVKAQDELASKAISRTKTTYSRPPGKSASPGAAVSPKHSNTRGLSPTVGTNGRGLVSPSTGTKPTKPEQGRNGNVRFTLNPSSTTRGTPTRIAGHTPSPPAGMRLTPRSERGSSPVTSTPRTGSKTMRTSRKEALNQVDAIIARSWSDRDGHDSDGWKSPTNFGADSPSVPTRPLK